MSIQRTKYQK